MGLSLVLLFAIQTLLLVILFGLALLGATNSELQALHVSWFHLLQNMLELSIGVVCSYGDLDQLIHTVCTNCFTWLFHTSVRCWEYGILLGVRLFIQA